MKKYLLILAAVIITVACNNTKEEEKTLAANEPYVAGEEVDSDGAIPVEEMLIQLGNGTEMPAKVRIRM